MAVNPETTIRKLVSLPRPMVQRIEDFRFQQRVKTESEAIRRLIEIGLDHAPGDGPASARPTASPRGADKRSATVETRKKRAR